MLRFDPRIRLPKVATRFFPNALWRLPGDKKQVALTFDDGPVPEVTPWVLKLLKEENIKACFFCVGENVKRHPEVYRQILANGHQVGNHTFNHLQGLKTKDEDFFANIEKAAKYVDSRFMRPPHGWMRKSQYRKLVEKYQVVMWDLISRDYITKVSPDAVVSNVMNFVRPGSIIIFHDSVKAQKNLKPALPVVIKKLKQKGYQFTLLPEEG
ncbi:polysaccharide deacetylase family protein [Sunxiuqinia dokdonensis]|uniref:polysaccharide deacetylase family protein n=1 Tax=Sunxiuqinia dokdonensis TaxID=1409788 RepID=UPI00069DCE12|nr:polysaccharide deacetylase family protein [Sunxiuqinia dokdonensis]